MNQFEAAKLKQQKKAERIAGYALVAAEALGQNPAHAVHVPLEAPKEKPEHAAFIHVKVVLPDREFTVCMTKPHIYQNITPNKLTKSEIKKCLEDGFRSLLGGLDDVP